MDPEKQKNEEIMKRIIKSGGQLLPGMVPFSSGPDSGQQQSEEGKQDNEDFSEEPWINPGAPNPDKDGKDLESALRVFHWLLKEKGALLQACIKELQEMADSTDKEEKIAVICVAAVGAFGLVAASGIYLFDTLPRKASFAMGLCGFVVAAVGNTAYNKFHTSVSKKKLGTVLKEYFSLIEEFEGCLGSICSCLEPLKKCDLPALKSERVTRLVQVAEDCIKATGPLSKSSGLIQGSSPSMGIQFSTDDSKEMKNGTETKFTGQIRMLALQLGFSLTELMQFRTVLSRLESADI